jgi:RNA polymerase sigma-70 factor (ECF subfamily)
LDQNSQSVDTAPFEDQPLGELNNKVGRGDTSAFATLYDTTSCLIFGLLLRFLPEQAAAEETLLDVYSHIWAESSEYDPESFLPLEWLVSVTRARAIQKLDATKEGKKRKVTEADPTASPKTVAPAVQNQVRSILDSLTPSQQEILDWVFYTGLSSSEIAVQSGKPQGAVRTHTRIGISKLYDLFRPLYERGAKSEKHTGGQNIEA